MIQSNNNSNNFGQNEGLIKSNNLSKNSMNKSKQNYNNINNMESYELNVRCLILFLIFLMFFLLHGAIHFFELLKIIIYF